VKCRGQQDLNDKMTIDASLLAETKFFTSHPVWQKVDLSLVGVDSLKDKLVSLLEVVVTNGLSGVLAEIDSQLAQNTSNLESLGQSMESAAERRNVFAAAVDEYTRILQDAISGKYGGEFFKVATVEESSDIEDSAEPNGIYLYLTSSGQSTTSVDMQREHCIPRRNTGF
jgi:hypothetical protein